MDVGGLPVEVIRKDIKNLHLAVYPPTGRVRVAVPLRLDDESVRRAVRSRVGWIRRQQRGLAAQDRQSQREMVTGESHYAGGRRYLLEVIEEDRPARIVRQGTRKLRLYVRPGTERPTRARVLERWYRSVLREQITGLLERWLPTVKVRPASWGIRRMKTRWGTCNPEAGRIWLNLELAKKSPQCAEYVLVHELVHLLERRHGPKFLANIDLLMPDWRMRRAELNREPLAHEEWDY